VDMIAYLRGLLDVGKLPSRVVFTDTAWVVASEEAIRAGGPVPPDLIDYLKGLLNTNRRVKSLTLTETGRWVVITENDIQGGGGPPPPGLLSYVQAVVDSGKRLKSVALLHPVARGSSSPRMLCAPMAQFHPA